MTTALQVEANHTLRDTSRTLAAEGLTVIPLRRNDDGFPKIPIAHAWQMATPSTVSEFEWENADGIGLVLGRASGNRAAIDIDDQPLAAAAFAYELRQHRRPLMSYTARTRIHLHVVEPRVSSSTTLKLEFQGRPVMVELKAGGTQIAIPPTEGYLWANPDWEPLYGSIAEVWDEIASALEVRPWKRRSAGAGYPQAFQHRVAVGERNNALFIEACRLAEAGVPIEKAVTFLQKRTLASYDGRMSGREVFATIRSAYKHVLVKS